MSQLNSASQKEAANVAFCFSHPVRLIILECLSTDGKTRFMHVQRRLNLAVATVFQHLAILCNANLVVEIDDATDKRMCFYALTEDGRNECEKIIQILREIEDGLKDRMPIE